MTEVDKLKRKLLDKLANDRREFDIGLHRAKLVSDQKRGGK